MIISSFFLAVSLLSRYPAMAIHPVASGFGPEGIGDSHADSGVQISIWTAEWPLMAPTCLQPSL